MGLARRKRILGRHAIDASPCLVESALTLAGVGSIGSNKWEIVGDLPAGSSESESLSRD